MRVFSYVLFTLCFGFICGVVFSQIYYPRDKVIYINSCAVIEKQPGACKVFDSINDALDSKELKEGDNILLGHPVQTTPTKEREKP